MIGEELERDDRQQGLDDLGDIGDRQDELGEPS